MEECSWEMMSKLETCHKWHPWKCRENSWACALGSLEENQQHCWRCWSVIWVSAGNCNIWIDHVDVSAELAPRLLTNEHKEHCVEVCQDLCKHATDDPSFMSRINTGDESRTALGWNRSHWNGRVHLHKSKFIVLEFFLSSTVLCIRILP